MVTCLQRRFQFRGWNPTEFYEKIAQKEFFLA